MQSVITVRFHANRQGRENAIDNKLKYPQRKIAMAKRFCSLLLFFLSFCVFSQGMNILSETIKCNSQCERTYPLHTYPTVRIQCILVLGKTASPCSWWTNLLDHGLYLLLSTGLPQRLSERMTRKFNCFFHSSFHRFAIIELANRDVTELWKLRHILLWVFIYETVRKVKYIV